MLRHFCIFRETEFGMEQDPLKQRKFIVFESQLLLLLMLCSVCYQPCRVLVHSLQGSMLTLMRKCTVPLCGHTELWSSQPRHGKMPMGNLLMAGAVLFTGSLPTKALRMLTFMKTACISVRTFTRLQSSYLLPAVFSVWETKRAEILKEREGKPLNLGGDGRCSAPGHTAKYGTYSLMDLDTSTVIDVQTVQVSTVADLYYTLFYPRWCQLVRLYI